MFYECSRETNIESIIREAEVMRQKLHGHIAEVNTIEINNEIKHCLLEVLGRVKLYTQ